jgi:hypothetical protein
MRAGNNNAPPSIGKPSSQNGPNISQHSNANIMDLNIRRSNNNSGNRSDSRGNGK